MRRPDRPRDLADLEDAQAERAGSRERSRGGPGAGRLPRAERPPSAEARRAARRPARRDRPRPSPAGPSRVARCARDRLMDPACRGVAISDRTATDQSCACGDAYRGTEAVSVGHPVHRSAHGVAPTDRDRSIGAPRDPRRGRAGVRSPMTVTTCTFASRARSRRCRRGPPSDPGLVLPGPRVDPDRVAALDEDRHLDDEAGLGRRRLAGAGLRVAGEAGLGVDDREVDGDRQLDADASRPGSSCGRASSRP